MERLPDRRLAPAGQPGRSLIRECAMNADGQWQDPYRRVPPPQQVPSPVPAPPAFVLPPGTWVFHPDRPAGSAHGLRIAAGILSLILSPWCFISGLGVLGMPRSPEAPYGLMGLILLLSAPGVLTA